MGKEIDYKDHLVYLNPERREREAIERIMVGVYGRNSADIARYFGLHHYAHTLLVDVPWDAFVSDRENCQGDIDFAIIPTSLKDDRYVNGCTELTYDFDNLLLLEVKTSVMQLDKIGSRKSTLPQLGKTLGQISKYFASGFSNAAIFQIVLGEPQQFIDEHGQRVEGIWQWSAALDQPMRGAQAEFMDVGKSVGKHEVRHVVMSYGAIPGLMEGTAGVYSFMGEMIHCVKERGRTANVKSELVNVLKQTLPLKWGLEGSSGYPPMPVVRTCRSCKSFILSQSPVMTCNSCSARDS